MAQIQFKSKSIVWNHHLGVEYHELVPDKSKSLTDKVSLNDNLIIHGDNLKALKALLPTYAGKVKCIYIDPPYNTGNEGWVYSDNVSSPMMKEWLGKVVDREDLTRHDKWLCMMTPRLKALKELLAYDGVIFVSIDENELHRLLMLMTEIFGEENYVATLVWRKRRGGGNDSSFIAIDHEYIVIFANQKDVQDQWRIEYEDEYLARYKEEDDRGRFYWDTLSRPGLNNPIVYDVQCPDGQIIKNGTWQISESNFKDKLEKGDVKFDKNQKGSWTVSHKVRMPIGKVLRSVIEDAGGTFIGDSTNKMAADEMEEIFKDKKYFDNPKPTALIKRVVGLITKGDDIVLDSFAGSGTTAQAVLNLNKEDGGNRKFIMVEMEDDVADRITAERVRRVIKGVPKAKNEDLQKGIGGSFSYFSLGDAIDEVGILSGKELPSYEQMARYLFYTATGEGFEEKAVDEAKNYIGKSKDYEVYLFYKPDVEYLKSTALNLEKAKNLPAFSGKKRLVFAPAKYLDQDHLNQFHIDFAQLPFEIYRKAT